MKWCAIVIFILGPVQLCGSSDYFSTYENLMKGVISFFSEHLYMRCAIVLQSNNQNWEENRETLKMTKYLIQIGSSFLTIPFELYLKYAHYYHYKRTCAKMVVIILGWQENAQVKFSELSHLIWMADYKWLIFLSNNTMTGKYLKNVYAPFNSEIMIAKLRKNQVDLEEGYRVAENYPLRILKYGVLNSDQKFVAMSDDYLYARRKDMEGFPVRASTRDDYPISRLARMKYSGQFIIEGYFGHVYYELADLLNYTAVYVEAVENATGVRLKGGAWNGILGMIQRDEIDFAVGPISFVRELTTVAGALRPILRTKYQIFYQLQGTVISWNDIFKPFAKHVWLSVIVWVLIATYTLNRFFYIECSYGHENRKYQKEYSKMNSFLTFLQALCQQGSHFVPESNSCRVIYITGYFASTILLTAYSAVLISNLTTQAPRRPFDSLETFLEVGSHELIAIQKSTDYSYFSDANDTLRERIYEKLMKHIPEDKLPTDKEGGIDEVCQNKKRALFITHAVSHLTADMASNEKGCPILFFRTPLDTIFLTIARKKYFPYSNLIDYRLQNMAEFGILSRLQREQWPLGHFHNEVHFREVTLEQVVQIHFLWISGMIMSLIFLYLEKTFHDEQYRHSCGIFCRRGKILRKIEKFVKNHFAEIKIAQSFTFWMLAIIIVIIIIYAF